MKYLHSQSISTAILSQPIPSTTLLPSLERGNLSNPRPRPTILSSSRELTVSKGKAKHQERLREKSPTFDPDWDPSTHDPGDLDSDINDPVLDNSESEINVCQGESSPGKEKPIPSTSTRKSAARLRGKSVHINPAKEKGKGSCQSPDKMLEIIFENHSLIMFDCHFDPTILTTVQFLQQLDELRDSLTTTDNRVKLQEEDVKVLNQLPRRFLDDEAEQPEKKKTRGG